MTAGLPATPRHNEVSPFHALIILCGNDLRRRPQHHTDNFCSPLHKIMMQHFSGEVHVHHLASTLLRRANSWVSVG